MRRRKYCARCQGNREAKSPSMDYCVGCYNSIKERLENPMLFARAVGTLCQTQPYNEEIKFDAFMAVFHPQYSIAQVRKLRR